MADITLHLKNVNEISVSMSVDEDQMLKVPFSVDASREKRAGDIAVGEAVFHGSNCYTVVAPPE
jgi:hypothetical protein